MKKTKFRQKMISDALKAEETLGTSPLAPKLKAHGITPALMATAARELTELHTQLSIARAALAQASAALAERAAEFAQQWSSYSNLVRGMTTDEALRFAHGVASPGVNKGPRFHRAPRVQPAPAPAPAPANGVTIGHG